MLRLNPGHRRGWAPLVAGLAAVLAGSVPARAAPTHAAAAPASDDAGEVVRIWYRSSAGCPDGGEFIGLLRRFGREGMLAGVGDRVDFVVTLAHAPRESTGRLERQSSAQTVAIRDAAAASCREVAEVLALSLELALQPAAVSAPSVGAMSAPGESPTAESAAAAPGSHEPASPEAPADERPLSAEGPSTLDAPSTAPDGWQLRLGAQGTFATGVARAALPGAAVFVNLVPGSEAWSARASLRGARGERDAAIGLSLWLLQARTEACRAWALGAVTLGPCGGVEAGRLFVGGAGEGGRNDDGFWSGATLHLRVAWQLSRELALELQGGAIVPFVRYRFEAATGGEVTRSAVVGADSALGISFLL